MSDDLIPACPYADCDSPTITKHVGGMHRATDGKPSYRCRDCGRHFEEPNHRPRRGNNTVGNLSDAGRALVEADPDDFEIRTDGGRTVNIAPDILTWLPDNRPPAYQDGDSDE